MTKRKANERVLGDGAKGDIGDTGSEPELEFPDHDEDES